MARYSHSARKADPEKGVSEIIGVILIIALTIALAAVISSVLMGSTANLKKPTLSGFAMNPFTNATGKITAIEFHLMAGDTLLTNSSGSSNQGFNITGSRVVITDPTGYSGEVRLHNAATSTKPTILPGKSFFVFKRTQPYYFLSDNATNMIVGGGTGSGGGGGGGMNRELPHGQYLVSIYDLTNSNTIVYQDQITL